MFSLKKALAVVMDAKGSLGFFKTGEKALLEVATGVVRKIS